MKPICQRFWSEINFAFMTKNWQECLEDMYRNWKQDAILIHRSCQVDRQNLLISNWRDFRIQKGEIKMEHCNVLWIAVYQPQYWTSIIGNVCNANIRSPLLFFHSKQIVIPTRLYGIAWQLLIVWSII